MIKTFTIHSVKSTPVSSHRGSMTWEVIDELGRQRKVTGITTLDDKGYIETVKAIHMREAPLIEQLLKQSEGDIFTIDFGPINEAMGYIGREVYSDIKRLEHTSRMSSRVSRLAFLLGLVALAWLAFITYNSFVDFKAKTPLDRHELID